MILMRTNFDVKFFIFLGFFLFISVSKSTHILKDDFEEWLSFNLENHKEETNLLQQNVDSKLREAESQKVIIRVNKNSQANFKTIKEALNSIPVPNTKRVIILIAAGVYREKIVIPETLPFITFSGDAMNRTVITWNDSYSTIGSDGHPLETFNSASVAVNADYFVAINIVFENTASYSKSKVEQAVALRISGNKSAFYHCEFYGVQDTLYDHKGLHYFKNCHIQGSVDFIFGFGRSLYEGCTLTSISKKLNYITAQKRSTLSLDSGFSFKNSYVKGIGEVYLGRPWGEYSRVIFSYTFMEKIVLPQGWDDKFGSDKRNITMLYYGEYKCSGPGSNFSGRVPWVRKLTDQEIRPFDGTHFIQGDTWLTTH
ncbi:unnamed protein product [Lathyrus oleraceus]|nr:probable pectinesterase 53 [Pisum sativum]